MPKVWCRDAEHQFSFDVDESVCWPSQRLAMHRATPEFRKYADDTRSAMQLSVRFREGHAPDVAAGLGLDGLAQATDD